MSAQTKTKAQKAGKFLGIALFAFLMFFNIKFAVTDDSNGDINLSGLNISISTNSSYAYEWEDPPGGGGGGGGNPAICYQAYLMCLDDCEWYCMPTNVYYLLCLQGCWAGCSIGYNNCIG